MTHTHLIALVCGCTSAMLGCGKSDSPATGGNASSAASTASATSTARSASKTRVEKVTMNGVAWEVTLPEDMTAPQYKVTNPEYLGDDDMSLKLDATFPKFSTVDSYVERNVGKRLREKKQLGDAFLLVVDPQEHNAGKFMMTGMVPGETIGWHCFGAASREADIRAMCESVKYTKQ